MINSINQFAENWFNWQISMLWQVAILIAIIAAVDFVIKKWTWPQVRYALWLLVLVKLVLPPSLTSPASFTAEIPVAIEYKIKNSDLTPPDTEVIFNPEIELPIKTELPKIEIQNTPQIVEPVLVRQVSVIERISWKVYMLCVWAVGAIILALWLMLRLRGLRREHLKGDSKISHQLQELLQSTAQKMKLKKVPQIILTKKVCCPAVFGIFKPVLLLPANQLADMSLQDAEHIFLHELAHIKRGDLIIHAFYMILQIAYWFNPLLWLIRKHLQNLRELCCDATVARILREKTADYRQTLLETARRLVAEPVDPGLGLLGLFENSGRLIDRLRWLEKKTWKYRPLRIATVFILICFMSACVLPMAKFHPEADFIVKGTVTDAQTGKPIEGAKVGDVNEYADGKFYAITDEKGSYSYKTYYEEHSIKAAADGYKEQRKGFNTKLFGKEKEKVINFAMDSKNPKGDTLQTDLFPLIMESYATQKVKTSSEQQNNFSIKLANGTTVELVTVCDYPEDKPQCWRADGTEAEEKLFVKREIDYVDGKFGFIIKVDGPNDLSFAWNKIEGSKGWWGSCTVIDNENKQVNGYEAAMVKQYSGGDATNIRVGTATGYWKTMASHDGKSMTTTGGKNILFSQAYESDNFVGIIVSSPWDRDHVERIVAVDKNGQTHISRNIGSVSSGDIWQMTAKFYNIKLADIAEFQFQTRPYEWIEFKNVSLKPGNKTDVQVIAVDQESNGTGEKEKLQNLVEDFFKHNYRDITARKTIEWGEPVIDANGNMSIHYKYVATIWGKDKIITNQLFVFDENGKLISFDKIEADVKLYPIDFEITTPFLEGDSIEITEITGGTGKFEVGQTYTIKGKYRLASHNEAMLHVYATNGAIESQQGPVVKRGSGEFARTFTYKKEGSLHLSFYPANGGSSFGGIYFVEKGTQEKVPDISTITSTVRVNSKSNDNDSKENSQEIPQDVNENVNKILSLAGQIASKSIQLQRLKVQKAHADEIEKTEKEIESLKEEVRQLGGQLEGNMELASRQLAERILTKLQEFTEKYGLPLSEEIIEQFKEAIETALEAIDVNSLTEDAENIDVYVENFEIKPYQAGGLYTLTAKIGNKGTATAPEFRMNFYRGDPKENLNLFGKPQTGSHGAGPIKPGEFWNESSMPFGLDEGSNILFVVLDINNEIAEANENNNQAMLGIKVENGKIAKKFISQSAAIDHLPDKTIINASNAKQYEHDSEINFKKVKIIAHEPNNFSATYPNGETPLHFGVMNNHQEMAEMLISKGADVNAKDSDGNTPLHLAAAGGNPEMCKMLTEKGAQINVKNLKGRTPLDLAAANGHKQTAEFLISKWGKIVESRTVKKVFESFGMFDIPLQIGVTGRMLSLNEKDLIRGLEYFAEISDGKYPSSLDPNIVILELKDAFAAKEAKGEIDYEHMNKEEKQQARDKILDIFFASAFWMGLKAKEPYYASCVTSTDKNKVLASWQTSKDQRRVIYGNLGIETIELQSMQNDYKKVVSNGGTIELVGVCNYPSKDKKWWRPDGSPLGYEIETNDNSKYKSKDPGYEFVFTPLAGGSYFAIDEIKDSAMRSSIDVLKPDECMFGVRAHIKTNINKTNIKIKYVVNDKADWKTVAAHDGRNATVKFHRDKKIIFSQANDSASDVLITISDDLNNGQADRLIAINKKDEEIQVNLQTSLMVDGMRQQTFIIANNKASEIKSYKFQQTPYESITFKNISLRPDIAAARK
ncbi:MAG: hypothetical protein A2Y10_20545 [Planctomycetes bacterium GWF2_41_51]|nr:MAG: hypothetical protein A2Y10_20545 [Planctomycetes bacterium GWF2_41_51]HBG25696.1 hypothetical protein [Phycisphaerales bacterium]